MTQSTKIFFALLAGYIVFTTVRGHLRDWLVILGLKNGGGLQVSPTGSFSLPETAFDFSDWEIRP